MYATQEEAEDAEALFILQKCSPTHIKFTTVSNSFFDSFQKTRKLSSYESYLYAYNKHILPYFKDFFMDDITIQIVKTWKESIEEKEMKLSYNNKLYNILNNIFKFSFQFGMTTNPLQALGRFENKNDKVIADEEKIRYITLNNFNQFISVIDDKLWKTFFIFLFYTGMRKGEVLALNWNDIDFKNNVIYVNKTLYYKHSKGEITNTKTGKNRKIKMSKFLYNSLLDYKEYVKQYSDYTDEWFVFGNSRFLAPVNIDRVKAKYFQLINDKLKQENKDTIPVITLHEFRHSHVTLLINEYVKSGGTDTTKFFLMVADRMGHSIETMKRVYLHLFPTIQDDIVDLLDNL